MVSRPPQPSGVEGFCPRREATKVFKLAGALRMWVLRISGPLSPVAHPEVVFSPSPCLFICVTNICFYVFSGPLSFVFLH